MSNSTTSPGQLVKFRGREWVVMPSTDKDLVLLKPLSGSEDEITGVFLPLQMNEDSLESAELPAIGPSDLDDFASAKLLFNAARLSFRNASGPFRCMGKLGFRPRAYQVVPLVMALKQDIVRLLIADDVGVGKTVEALMILKEMLERGDVRRFAIVCLPHLCDQWRNELKDKLDIEAEIIRSSTAASLERRLPGDRSVFYHFPYQVISVDYIKALKRRDIFLGDCPELVIVDEAHAYTLPKGAKSPNQQQRYHLLHDIAKKPSQHLLLLTATPHSGKDEEFQSLLGLLNPEFATYELEGLAQNKRRKLAEHFIQRKRTNIERWHRTGGDETTPFPQRKAIEIAYLLSPHYTSLYDQILRFARGMTLLGPGTAQARIRYWAALALLRGVMSSPATAWQMLHNRVARSLSDDGVLYAEDAHNPSLDQIGDESDHALTELLGLADLAENEEELLGPLGEMAKRLQGPEHDWKLQQLIFQVRDLLKAGFHPIVFCKYIATAQYVGHWLRTTFEKAEVQTVTSELADDQRKERIETMRTHDTRILVATDCLSEGINLQDLFTAVVHYDLPWNPNRIEQREGRVDRFGQEAPEVRTILLYGKDNPIDSTVLNILVRKVMEIQRSTGVQISIGEENTSIVDAMIKEILMGTENSADGMQLSLFAQETITNELENARRRAENLRSIFAHESVAKEEIEVRLQEVDEAIGDMRSVEQFVCAAVQQLGGQVQRLAKGWEMHLSNLPEHLKRHFPLNRPVRASFDSPTPNGYRYIGRNHHFVEQLCQYMLGLAFDPKTGPRVARAAVIRTTYVPIRTTLIQFRVRNVIKEVGRHQEFIAEEMFLWGYAGSGDDSRVLGYAEAKDLLLQASSHSNVALPQQIQVLHEESEGFAARSDAFHDVAVTRAENLVAAHAGFKKLVGGKRYEAVQPVLPPDLMGVYVLLPVSKPIV